MSLLIVSTRRRLREARNSPKAYAREQIARLRDEQEVVEEMEEVMAQLEQFSRQKAERLSAVPANSLGVDSCEPPPPL